MQKQATPLTPEDLQSSKDFSFGIGQQVLRCRFAGARAVLLESETPSKTQIAALLDLLDLHLSSPSTHLGRPVAADRLAVLIGGAPSRSDEAFDALKTLSDALRGPKVELFEQDVTSTWRLAQRTPYDPSAAAAHYAKLLEAIPPEPPALVKQLIASVGHPALRAYPMLTSRGKRWSVRLEGLQIGVLSKGAGWLDVGSPGKDEAVGPTRRHWQAVTGWMSKHVLTPEDLDEAARGVSRFAASWLAEPETSTVGPTQQDEHALESRILRGDVALQTDDGTVLQLLEPHPEVNWGSQFPTRWGQGGKARYLDGLLRVGDVPWALEMKIQPTSGGLRQYYRHAIVQAVLYREFIKGGAPLEKWFTGQGLDRSQCRAAIVVPSLIGPSADLRKPLQRLCDAFDVTLIQVPHEAAEYQHRLLPSLPALPVQRQSPLTPPVDAGGAGTVGPSRHTER